jgi:hypothetical protein
VIYPPKPTPEQLKQHRELKNFKLPNVYYESDSGPIVAEFLRRARGDKATVLSRYQKICLLCGYINYDLKMDPCCGEKCDRYIHPACNATGPPTYENINNKLLCGFCVQKPAAQKEGDEEEEEEEKGEEEEEEEEEEGDEEEEETTFMEV